MATKYGDSANLEKGNNVYYPPVSVPKNAPGKELGSVNNVDPSSSAIRRIINSGGGGGSSYNAAAQAQARQDAINKANAERNRVAEQIELAKQRQAEIEKARILELQRKLLIAGAQKRIIESRNAMGEKIRQQIVNLNRVQNGKSTNASVIQRTNLSTGEVSYSAYERPRYGGSRQMTGSVFESSSIPRQTTKVKENKINNILTPKPNLLINAVNNLKNNTNQSNRILGVSLKPTSSSIPSTLVKNAITTAKFTGAIAKAVPEILVSFGKSLGSGAVKIPLYAIDEAGYISSIRYNPSNKKLYIPQGTKAISTNFGKLSKWVNYDFKSNPAKDEDIKNVVITSVLVLAASPALAAYGGLEAEALIVRNFQAEALQNVIKNPTPQNIAATGLLISGDVFKVSNSLATKKLENGKIVLRKAPEEIFTRKAKEIYLKSRVKPFSIKRPFSSAADFLKGRKPGQFKSFTKDKGLILKSQTVANSAKSLSEQTKFAGKTVTAVNAAAEQLTSWIRRKKIIRKPIPGENVFPVKIKGLLKKFDNGKRLTNKEFANVNSFLQKKVAPNITLLERSLYASPTSGLRINRLGISAERPATLRDIVRGNFKLRGSKPQVLVFENAKIANFPKSLSDIKSKLLRDKPLTTAETNRLIRWQVKTGSGKFKPIGSTIYQGGRELEITIAPGEYIKRVKKYGSVIIDGQKVTIVKAEIFKPSRELARRIKLANEGKLSKIGLKNIEKKLSKELGRNVRIETPKTRGVRFRDNVPVLRIDISRRLRNVSGIIRLKKSGSRSILRSRTITKPNIRRSNIYRNKPKNPAIRKGASRPIPRGGRGKTIPSRRNPPRNRPGRSRPRPTNPRLNPPRPIPGRGNPRNKPPRPIFPTTPSFSSRTLSRSQPTFYVVEKVRGKFRKLYPKPLALKDARDYAVYSIDNRLSKTAFFVPLGRSKRVVVPPRQIQNYASRNSFKVRPYRIRFGKKRQLVNGFIEKRKYFQDTSGEKRALRIARRMSPASRKIMLRNLSKARAVRSGSNIRSSPRMVRRNRPIRRVQIKLSPQRRRQLILQLKKARMVRMRNLRRRR